MACRPTRNASRLLKSEVGGGHIIHFACAAIASPEIIRHNGALVLRRPSPIIDVSRLQYLA